MYNTRRSAFRAYRKLLFRSFSKISRFGRMISLIRLPTGVIHSVNFVRFRNKEVPVIKKGAFMRSDAVKKGDSRAPHRSLLRACGLSDSDMKKPFIAIVGSHVDIIPGHVHLNAVNEYVKKAVRAAGGRPVRFHTIGICDGIAMGHDGMKYSLASRRNHRRRGRVDDRAHKSRG